MTENHHSRMKMRKRNISYSIRKSIKIPKDGSKSIGKKIFLDITRRGALPEEAYIHTNEMTPIKIALKKIHKIKQKMGNIQRLSEFIE